MQIIRGLIGGALKIVVYGPEGIGKSTFASQAPDPVFIDTEGSTKFMSVARTPKPSSWTMLIEQVQYFKSHPKELKTLVIDTGDWAEQLCVTKVCAEKHISGIEDIGYGKGYVYLEEDFGRLLNLLEDVVRLGVNVIINCHSQMRKFEQPDELGAYDRWELKLEKKTAALVKEWADIILFANYKTYVVNVDNQGAQKGKNKVQGGKRVMYTTHHPCWDAKNRQGLPDELPFEFASIAHLFTGQQTLPNNTQISTPPVQTEKPEAQAPIPAASTPPVSSTPQQTEDEPTRERTAPDNDVQKADSPGKEPEFIFCEDESIPKPLRDLMNEFKVSENEIQEAVAAKGYYPQNTPIKNYDPGFIDGVLIGAWSQVHDIIMKIHPLPF